MLARPLSVKWSVNIGGFYIVCSLAVIASMFVGRTIRIPGLVLDTESISFQARMPDEPGSSSSIFFATVAFSKGPRGPCISSRGGDADLPPEMLR